MWSWRTLILPKTLPTSSPWYYSFGYNETHTSLSLSYGSLVNNHESPNIKYASAKTDATKTGFVVRDDFQRGNSNVLNIRVHTCLHAYTGTHDTHSTHTHTHIFKATKDIDAGQELFVSYGGEKWFQSKGVTYTAFDYASTMWRPDLQPLPCCQNIEQTTDDNGLRSYTALSAIPSGTVLDVSLCIDVPANFVDQFPALRNSTLPGQIQHVHAVHQQASASLRANIACVFQTPETKRKSEILLTRFCISPLHAPCSNAQTRNHSKHTRPLDLVSFIRMKWKHECIRNNQTSLTSRTFQQCSRPQFDTGLLPRVHTTTP